MQLSYLKPDEVHEAVVDGSADVGILSYPDRFRKVRSIALRDEVMAVVCPPDHALAGRRTVNAGDLDGHEMIGFDADLPVAGGRPPTSANTGPPRASSTPLTTSTPSRPRWR